MTARPIRILLAGALLGLQLLLVPSAALASGGPTLSSQTVFSEGFETPLLARTSLAWALPTPGDPSPAYWGTVTARKHSGANGLWCAGSIPASMTAGWTRYSGMYPAFTAGLATFGVPELADYYSATLDFWYQMPSLGAGDSNSFNVMWASSAAPDRWESNAGLPIVGSMTHSTFSLAAPTPDGATHPVNLSRSAATVRFLFIDDVNTYENPTNGEGPTIDDVTVSGYKYGPVRNLSATVVDTGVHLSWSLPPRSTALLAPAEDRSLAYRVYRELDGSNVWTELTGTRITGTSFYDLDTAALVGTYRYVVQAWDTGVGPGYGQVAMAGDTTTQFFVGPKYTLAYSAAAHGSIVGSSTQLVGAGMSGTAVTAAPSTGYHFASWSDGGSTATRTDASVTADLTVVASFAINTYHLAYSAGGGGTISGATSQTVTYNGSGSAVTAVPNVGYHFAGWSDGGQSATRTDTSVTSDLSPSASFAINTYHLAYSAGSGGTISGTTSQTVAYNGSGSAVTAVAGGGYHFVSWSDGLASATRTDASVTGDVTVSAVFAITVPDTFTLAYTATVGGSIEGSATQVVVSGSSGTAVMAVASTGYHFAAWSDGKGTAARTDANVTRDVLVSAGFAINTYQLHYSALANGGISGAASQTVGYGGSGTAVTVVPNLGYHFVSWSDAVMSATRTDAGVVAGKSVSASFAIDTFHLTYTAGAHGTIGGVASQTVGYGASGTAVTAVGDPGYHFVSWSDGVPTAARTDNGVTDDVSVSASFAVDSLAPVFTITGVPDATTQFAVTPGYITTTVPAPTVEAWIDGTVFPWGSTYSAEGTHTLVVRLTNAAGSTWGSKVFVIDHTPPVTANNLPTGVLFGAFTVHLNATDNVTGVAKTYYKLDTATKYSVYGSSVYVSGWKDHTLYYYSVDKAGNVEAVKHVHFSMRIRTTLTITKSSTRATRNHSFTVYGYLSSSGSGARITLKYQKPGSAHWYTVTRYTVKSGTRGKWTYKCMPRTKGLYHFKVTYAGSSTTYKSASPTLAVRVY